MRKSLLVVLTLALGAPLLEAGGPPRRGRRGQRTRGPMMMRPMTGPRPKMDIFRVAQRYFDLNDEQEAALEGLDGQRDAEEREAIAELNRRLDKKYIALVIEIMPPESKDAYKKVCAAMSKRDELIAAAREEVLEALTKIRKEQGVEERSYLRNYVPYNKTDFIRRTLLLTEGQRKEADGIRRESWEAMRELMRDIPRPKDWRDAAARKKYSDAMRKAREEVGEQAAAQTVAVLTKEQKQAFETGSTALETYKKKVKDAEDACEATLVELLGEERIRAARGTTGRGDQPRRRPTQF